MSTASASVPAPAPSMPRRIAAVIGGLALLACATVLTAGTALAAPVGMAIAARVRRARRRPYTRAAGWLGAVVATAIVIGAASAVLLRRIPSGTFTAAQQQAAAERHQNPPQLPAFLRRLSPGAPSPAQMQAQTDSMVSSPGFLLGMGIIGGALMAISFGAFIGTVSWACTTLALYGLRGRWPAPGSATYGRPAPGDGDIA